VKDLRILPASRGGDGQGGFFYCHEPGKETETRQVELLTEKLKKAKVAVLTDYRGLKVSQIQELRKQAPGGDVEYRVVKNTLARRATEAAGYPALKDELKGPVAIAFGYDDLSISVEAHQRIRPHHPAQGRSGRRACRRSVFSPDQVKQLADLPSRETLIAQLMGTLQSPVAQLVGIMQTPLQQLLGVLEAYKTKLEAA